MSLTAKQIVFTGPRKLTIKPVELPPDTPQPGSVLLQTRVSFISAGTELGIYAGQDPRLHEPGSGWSYPHEPGYANIATVIAANAIPDSSPLQIGTRVFSFVPHVSHYAYKLSPWGLLEPVPDDLDDETAAAARMALVSISALQVADLALNDWVVVYGLGAVGNLAAQLFQLAGARVIGVDPQSARCKLAETCGIERTIAAAGEQASQTIRDLTDGKGPRISVDAVGHPAIIRDAMALTAAHGEVIVLGSPRATLQTNLTDLMRPVFGRWVTIKGALEWRLPQRAELDPHSRHSSEGNLRNIFDLIRRGRLHVKPLISHRMPYTDAKQGYEGLLEDKQHYTGVILTW